MNGRTIARVLLVVIIAMAAIGLGVTAYNAGVTAGLAANGNVIVNPAYPGVAVGPYVGYGWGWGGHGFGFFGFLFTLLFIFILFGLLRAAFGRGRGWGPGPYGRGWDGPDHDHGRWRDDPWTARVREVHDELHRSEGAGANRQDAPKPD